MNKIQALLARRAYRRGIAQSARNTLYQAHKFGFKMVRESIVSMQLTQVDNDFYNKKLFGNKAELVF